MPLIRVTSSGEPLSVEQRRELGRELTDVLLEIEGGARTDRARSLAYVMFEHLADESWTVGGDMSCSKYYPAPTRLMARVDVPVGSLNSRGSNERLKRPSRRLSPRFLDRFRTRVGHRGSLSPKYPRETGAEAGNQGDLATSQNTPASHPTSSTSSGQHRQQRKGHDRNV
jgi:phenylpyruvate tautomerase PptA (4-oxalocrotonate tautomerase family)